jgi:hypothetical protein
LSQLIFPPAKKKRAARELEKYKDHIGVPISTITTFGEKNIYTIYHDGGIWQRAHGRVWNDLVTVGKRNRAASIFSMFPVEQRAKVLAAKNGDRPTDDTTVAASYYIRFDAAADILGLTLEQCITVINRTIETSQKYATGKSRPQTPNDVLKHVLAQLEKINPDSYTQPTPAPAPAPKPESATSSNNPAIGVLVRGAESKAEPTSEPAPNQTTAPKPALTNLGYLDALKTVRELNKLGRPDLATKYADAIIGDD